MNQPPPGPQGPPQQSVHPGYQQGQGPQGYPPGQGPPGHGPQGYPVAQPAQKKSNSCLLAALIGGGVLVVFIGIIAALGIYGMRRYLASAKSSEAKNTVGAISRGAVAAYEREQLGPSGASTHTLCASARPVPLKVPSGKKYQAAPGDWTAGGPNSGWQCLRFSMTMPQYYQYHYNAGGGYVASGNPDTPSGTGFEAAAKGDLDGDGVHSTFARTGEVSGSQLRASTQIYIENEFE